MISEDRVEKAVEYIRDHADRIGELRGHKEYLVHRQKVERSQAFLEASGTVAEREATSWVDPRINALGEEYRDCVTELETVLTKVKAAELTIAVWQTMSANSRRGHL